MAQDKDTAARQVDDPTASKTAQAHTVSSGTGSSRANLQMPDWRQSARHLQAAGLGLIVLVLLVGGLAGFGGAWLANRNGDGLVTGNVGREKKIVSSQSQLISQIAKSVGPSVVSVNVSIGEGGGSDAFGFAPSRQAQGAGTGIIINSDGLIVTNRHVVPTGTTSVSVTLSDGTELNDVSVIGRTSDNDTLDIAFLKINDSEGHKLAPATLGNSSVVQVGDDVVAIGNALGQFQNTVTSGIISGYGRSLQTGDSTGRASGEGLVDLFQTDAAINEGNSGGPLVNLNGQVIGINTAVAGNAENIGFAIPINDIKGSVEQVSKTGKLTRPYLGVRYVQLTGDIAKEFKIDTSNGALIVPVLDPASPSVLPDSPAAKAGLRPNDVIVAVNGTKIDQSHSLTALLSRQQPGDKIKLTILRDGKTAQVAVTLGAQPTN